MTATTQCYYKVGPLWHESPAGLERGPGTSRTQKTINANSGDDGGGNKRGDRATNNTADNRRHNTPVRSMHLRKGNSRSRMDTHNSPGTQNRFLSKLRHLIRERWP